MELKISAYHTRDKAKLIAILRLNVPDYFAESEVEDFDNYLDHEIEKYFVAELNGTIVGSGGVNFEDHYRVGKISWDVVHPEFQGIGVGRKLLQHRIALLKSVSSIEVITVRTSQLAYQFYEKNGFALKEVYKDHWAKGFDMYKMIYEGN